MIIILIFNNLNYFNMGIFNFLDKFVSKTFDNLSDDTIEGLSNQVKNAELPPSAIKLQKDIEERGIDLRYISKSLKTGDGHGANRQDVNNLFNELYLIVKNGILYSEEVFNGIDSLGELSSDFITKDNERFSGMVYFITIDSEFNVKEISWVRNFVDGVLSNSSEKYRYNQLVERTIFDNGNIKKIENFVRKERSIVGRLNSITEFETNHEFTKTIYDSLGNYKVEIYKDNKPHGDWLDFKTFDFNNKTTYLASRERYNEGLENGKWEWYNKDGIITMTQYWKDGSDSFLKDEIEKFNVGVSYNSIIRILGEPDFIKNTISNGKSRRKIYYGKSINRLGNDAYAFEISFVDDKLFGFKELGQVGINNK